MLNLTYLEGVQFQPEDDCKVFDIDWSEACPDAYTLDDFTQCFTNSDLASSIEVDCPPESHIFDQSQFTSTVVTDWQLVCQNAYIEPLISTIFMAGLLFGVSIFGPIMDRYGRLKVLLLLLFLLFLLLLFLF